MARGLPQINIVFQSKALTAIERSKRGIVACILRDNTANGNDFNVYESLTDVDFTQWTEKNYDYMKLIYEGSPNKLIVIRQSVSETNYAPALKKLKDLNWNYLTVPDISKADTLIVSSWIKEQRDENKKTFKAVLPCCVADHEGIINFTNDNIKTIYNKTFSNSEYCARIAGLLAGLSLTRSSTYYNLSDIVSADIFDDPNDRINKGEFIIIFDSENYKIGRGINSLTTFTTKKSEDFSKIKIIEGIDLYQDDIRTTFEDYYIGKVRNNYDSKQALIAAINSYHKAIEGDILDDSFDNTAMIDIAAQKQYLESKGIDTKGMNQISLAIANTGSTVFITSHVKFIDAMEDMTMEVNM